MPYFPTTDITGVSDGITDLNVTNGDIVIIDTDIDVIASDRGIFINYAAMAVQVDGTVYGANYGLRLDATVTIGFSYEVAIGETGAVAALNDYAVYLGSNTDSAIFDGNRITLSNAGTITGYNCGAVFLFDAETVSVANSGMIETLAEGKFYEAALALYHVTTADVVNTGSIRSHGLAPDTTSAAVWFGNGSATFALRNYGEILAPVLAIYSEASLSDRVENFGVINGDVTLSSSANSFLRNNGLINGTVMLGAGDDELRSGEAGLVTGAVYGEIGADRLVGGAQGDELFGGDSGDTLVGHGGIDSLSGDIGLDFIDGGADNDVLAGGLDADTIWGGSGDDSAQGGDGDDRVSGNAGDDSLFGDAGNDSVSGQLGDDSVSGGSGADTLAGGAGDDTLLGDLGKDRLIGGLGFDVFLFLAPMESPNSNQADVIADFASGVDLIDLSALTAAPLAFQGAAAFVGGGTASLRVTTGASQTTVLVDVDGNGSADMRINLTGSLTLTAADFVL